MGKLCLPGGEGVQQDPLQYRRVLVTLDHRGRSEMLWFGDIKFTFLTGN